MAAQSAVNIPTNAMRSKTSGSMQNILPMRATRYTPLVTIVAAWMSADTGVGPAMASGSQVRSGICADLPVHPTKNNTPVKVRSVNTRSRWPPFRIICMNWLKMS